MGKLVKLFVYGELRPGRMYTPKTMVSSHPDAVQGVFFPLQDDDKAAIFSPKINSLVDGDVLTIDSDELESIDKEELPEWKRVEVFTSKGVKAFAYEYDHQGMKTIREEDKE